MEMEGPCRATEVMHVSATEGWWWLPRKIDIFLYLHLSIIDIGISPEIRMPIRFWTDRASGTE